MYQPQETRSTLGLDRFEDQERGNYDPAVFEKEFLERLYAPGGREIVEQRGRERAAQRLVAAAIDSNNAGSSVRFEDQYHQNYDMKSLEESHEAQFGQRCSEQENRDQSLGLP